MNPNQQLGLLTWSGRHQLCQRSFRAALAAGLEHRTAGTLVLAPRHLTAQKISAVPAAAPLSSPSVVRSPYPLHMSCHPRPDPRPLSPSRVSRRTPCPLLRVTDLPLAPEPQVAPPPSRLLLSPNQRLRPTWTLSLVWEVIPWGQNRTA